MTTFDHDDHAAFYVVNEIVTSNRVERGTQQHTQDYMEAAICEASNPVKLKILISAPRNNWKLPYLPQYKNAKLIKDLHSLFQKLPKANPKAPSNMRPIT